MTGYYVQTFGGFGVSRDGTPLSLQPDVERLIAFLCLHPGRMPRVFVAASLWEDCDEHRALANLRSALWRLRRSDPDLVDADNHAVSLASDTASDIADVTARAELLWYGHGASSRDRPSTAAADASTGASPPALPWAERIAHLDHTPFAHDFLPGWYEEWAVVERERMRQLRLHCLESIAEIHLADCRYAAAMQVLLVAITLDQLRESPRRQLMAVHLAEGNASEVVRQYDEYAALLDEELGLEPSLAMKDLLSEARDPSCSRARRSRDAADASR